jgi:protein O-mannosyl-transferase
LTIVLLTKWQSNLCKKPTSTEVLKKNYIAIALIAVITTLAYWPVLFNFFCGDDFVHLVWLSKAIDHPEMLLRNFNHNWLDIATFRFYRPLISVFMYTDYLIWRTNGFGFHLTNVLFHISNSILVYIIGGQLFKIVTGTQASNTIKEKSFLFPLLAGLIFALYPLHCEAVSWITGRVDDIVTTFYLLTLCLFIQWRQNRSNAKLVLSLASMALALMSKEMAVTLPALLLSFDIFLPSIKEQTSSLLEKIKRGILATSPFWILLVAYFVVRRIALGTFVGGYDDSLFFIANMHEFLAGWRNGLTMIAQPANQLIIGSHNIGLIAWDMGGIFAIIGLFIAMKNSTSKKLLPFLLIWIALALAPVYKIFSISIDLQSSRLAYLMTAPLSILLAWGLSEGATLLSASKKIPIKPIFSAAAMLFLCGAFFLLFKNNEAWHEAGVEMNAVRQNLAHVYEQIDDDPQTLLLGIPDQHKGAYEGRNAVPEMLQRPQFPRDVTHCVAFNTTMPILPFGYLRRSLAENVEKAKVLLWDQEHKNWLKVSEATPQQNDVQKKIALNLQAIEAHTKTDKEHNLQTITSENLDYGKTEFLFVGIAPNLASEMRGKAQEISLAFTNQLSKTTRAPIKIDGHPLSIDGKRGLIFALRACPYWVFAQHADNIEITLPASMVVTSIESMTSKELMPQLSFPNSGFLGTKGFTHLSKRDSKTVLTCTSNDVPGAKTVALEVIRPNLFLAANDLNAPEPSRLQQRLLKSASKTGDIILERKDFPADGIYQARLFALDANGDLLGLAGDHIDIAVEPD